MPFLSILASAGIGLTIFATVRWIGRQSLTLQTIVAGGLLARTILGLSLFWISYLGLPILPSLQFGGGFWTPMVDATGYFQGAATAAEQGLSTISPGSGSPFFTKTLAIWMQVVGVSPCAGMFLNLSLYIGSCALLTRLFRPVGRWRLDLPLVITVGAISFSPVLLIDSTQPLKDDVFLMLVIVVCAATLLLFQSMLRATANRRLKFGAALCVLAAAIYGIAGIRAYYPVIVSACLALALTCIVIASSRGLRLRRGLTGAIVMGTVWCAYWSGAGTDYRPSLEERHRIAESLHWNRGAHAGDGALETALFAVDGARTGFVASGGDTNIARDPNPSAVAPPVARESSPNVSADAAPVAPKSAPDVTLAYSSHSRFTLVGVGLAVIVVPISILKATSVVGFSGGRGLLPVADVDAVFMDASLLALGFLVFRRRHAIGDHRAFVIFGVTLGVVTAVLLGYVVTNFGTLFRMRYLVATPLWMLALAISPRQSSVSRLADKDQFDRG